VNSVRNNFESLLDEFVDSIETVEPDTLF
jgi:hypothetical protein